MMQAISWTVDRDQFDDFVLWWWPRGDNYCYRNHATLSSTNFTDAIKEAKYFIGVELNKL